MTDSSAHPFDVPCNLCSRCSRLPFEHRKWENLHSKLGNAFEISCFSFVYHADEVIKPLGLGPVVLNQRMLINPFHFGEGRKKKKGLELDLRIEVICKTFAPLRTASENRYRDSRH